LYERTPIERGGAHRHKRIIFFGNLFRHCLVLLFCELIF
jgi:hypothetical protein